MREKKLLQVERKIIGDIWQNNEIKENMHYMADRLGSRFAGTESEEKAQKYMMKKFKENGYDHVYKNKFSYFGWERGPVNLEMIAPYTRELPAISLVGSPKGNIRGKVTNVGTGSPQEFKAVGAKNIKDHIVLCSSATSPEGERVHRRTKYGYAVKYGAKGFIFMNHNPGRLPPTGSLRPAYKMAGEIPGIGVSSEIGKLMLRLSKGKELRVRIQNKSKIIPESTSANILAELPGDSKKDEWIVIGSHFDGHDIAQGAMDNLSGTVVTMELARVLKKYKGEFRRNIRFICFACEELGVTGSTRYVTAHQEEMEQTALMLNLELGGVAYKNGTQHIAFNVHQPSELKKQLEKYSKEIQYPLKIRKETSSASDHWPFYVQGVPTVSAVSEPSPRQKIKGRGWGHTQADMMDKVDTRNLQESAMIIGRLLLRFANKKEKPAEHTSFQDIVTHLENTGRKEILEIQKKWPPTK